MPYVCPCAPPTFFEPTRAACLLKAGPACAPSSQHLSAQGAGYHFASFLFRRRGLWPLKKALCFLHQFPPSLLDVFPTFPTPSLPLFSVSSVLFVLKALQTPAHARRLASAPGPTGFV